MTRPRTSRKHRNDVRPLSVWIVVAVLATALVGAALMYVFAAISGYGAWPFAKRPGTRPELYDITRSAVAAGAFLGAAVVAAITVRRQRSTELSFDADELSRLRDRYTTAAGQLGHESPAVRLAGAYALAGLADEWLDRNEPAEAQTSIDLLCAYMRTPRETLNDADKAADREIRQSIIRIITSHLQETSQPSWSGRHFDFTNANFDGRYDFGGATFSGDRVSFHGTTFSGDWVTFHGTTFSGKRVSFQDAAFSSDWVSFDKVTFSSDLVFFQGATFSGKRVFFRQARFSDFVSFHGATFSGHFVTFHRASFSSGSFSRVGAVSFDEATFSGDLVIFDEATFSGGVSFNQATFYGRNVSFRGATFSGDLVIFDEATFSGDRVSFQGATFSGDLVSFGEAAFSGGWVSFDKTSVTEGCTVLGPWPDGPLPKRWPVEGKPDPDPSSS